MKLTRAIVMIVSVFGALSCDTFKSITNPEPLRITFTPGKVSPVDTGRVHAEGDVWRVYSDQKQNIRLFEIPVNNLEASRISFNTEAKAEEVFGSAHLEMWVNVPGKGEFFSKALDTPLRGNMDWSHYSAPFFLGGEQPDRIRLELAFADKGTIYLRNVHIEVTQR